MNRELRDLLNSDIYTDAPEYADRVARIRELLKAQVPFVWFRQNDPFIDAVPCWQSEHAQDSDCDVDPETNCCRQCGVEHGDPCNYCSARGYHKVECRKANNEDNRVFAAQTFGGAL